MARKYEIITLLGAGWEGEIYLNREFAIDAEQLKDIALHRMLTQQVSVPNRPDDLSYNIYRQNF